MKDISAYELKALTEITERIAKCNYPGTELAYGWMMRLFKMQLGIGFAFQDVQGNEIRDLWKHYAGELTPSIATLNDIVDSIDMMLRREHEPEVKECLIEARRVMLNIIVLH